MNKKINNKVKINNLSYKNAKKTINALNIFTGVIAVWLIFFPTNQKIQFIILAIIPPFSIYLIREYNGIITLENDNSSKPSLNLTLVISSFSLAINCLINFSIFNSLYIYIYLIIIISFLLFLSFQFAPSLKKDFYPNLILLSFYGLVYSFALIIFINCYFNEQADKKFYVKILDKYQTKGKNSSNIFVLEKWHNLTKNEKEDVKKSIYNSKNIGDYIEIEYYDGLIGIPWYNIKD